MEQELSDLEQIQEFIDKKGDKWVAQALRSALIRGLRFESPAENHEKTHRPSNREDRRVSAGTLQKVLDSISEKPTEVSSIDIGMSKSSVANAVSKLVATNRIKMVRRGFYSRVEEV